MSEIAQAFLWIDTTMLADTALVAAAVGGTWQGLADDGTLPPYASFDSITNSDTNTMQAVRLFNRGTFEIKAVGPSNNYAVLVIIANHIDALFKDVKNVGLSGGGGVLSCYRESAFSYNEMVNGVQWSHLGGLYHIDLQGS